MERGAGLVGGRGLVRVPAVDHPALRHVDAGGAAHRPPVLCCCGPGGSARSSSSLKVRGISSSSSSAGPSELSLPRTEHHMFGPSSSRTGSPLGPVLVLYSHITGSVFPPPPSPPSQQHVILLFSRRSLCSSGGPG